MDFKRTFIMRYVLKARERGKAELFRKNLVQNALSDFLKRTLDYHDIKLVFLCKTCFVFKQISSNAKIEKLDAKIYVKCGFDMPTTAVVLYHVKSNDVIYIFKIAAH